MTNVGPSTPVGTACIFIGPAVSTPDRIGTAMTIEAHVKPRSIEQTALLMQFGFLADVIVRAESDGCLAATRYTSLIRIDGDDPDADERIADDQPNEVTA